MVASFTPTPHETKFTAIYSAPRSFLTRNFAIAMRFESLIGIRYLRARRRERFVSLIAIISLAGVALGTFALTVTLAVMSGFQQVLRDRLLAFTPQVTIERAAGGALDGAALNST